MWLKSSFRLNYNILGSNQIRWKYNWVQPIGYDTGIKIFNALAKQKVPLIFPNKNRVTWYMCGPTVYNTPHIGHASCYVKFDIIRRILQEYFDITPIVALGITDVSTEIYEKANSFGKSWQSVAEKYEKDFFNQMKALNVLTPSVVLRVQHNIPVIINFINHLLDKKVAYKASDGIYFKVACDKNYGRFRMVSNVTENDEKSIKENPADFALWRNTEIGDWEPDFGKGIPGWHIECSAMASHIFGESVDLHSGGCDLMFPHHENEEAQSTSYHGCTQWVNYWLHTGLIKVGKEKMSKSLGNFVPISEFLRHNTSDEFRMFCLMSSYMKSSSYDEETIKLAVSMCAKIQEFFNFSEEYLTGRLTTGNIEEAQLLEKLEKTKVEVKTCLSDDFATAEAFKVVYALVQSTMGMFKEPTGSRSLTAIAAVRMYVKQFFYSLGFQFEEESVRIEASSVSAIEAINDIVVNFRSDIRRIVLDADEFPVKKQMLNICDDFRAKLRDCGVFITDTSSKKAAWTFQEQNAEAGSVIKYILDSTVGFTSQLRIPLDSLNPKYYANLRKEIKDVIRLVQMRFSVLGINISDSEDGRAYWTYMYSEMDDLYQIEVADSITSYLDKIRLTAQSITDQDVQLELITTCDAALFQLNSIKTANKEERDRINWTSQHRNNKLILQDVIDISCNFYTQLLALSAYIMGKDLTKPEIVKVCYKAKRMFNFYGIIIQEFNKSKPFYADENLSSKLAFDNIVDLTINSLNSINKIYDSMTDPQAKFVLKEVCMSLIRDLNNLGIEVSETQNRTKWSYKSCKSEYL